MMMERPEIANLEDVRALGAARAIAILIIASKEERYAA